MILLQLFLVFMQIGVLSFGGGLSAIMLVQQVIVEQRGWLTMQQYTDIVTIAEVTPGPMGLNAATFVGTQLGGIGGAIIATIGFLLPSLIIVLALAYFFFRFNKIKGVHTVVDTVKPPIAAIIVGAGFSIFLLAIFDTNDYAALAGASPNFLTIAIFCLAFIVVRWKKKLSPILVIFAAGALGLIGYFL